MKLIRNFFAASLIGAVAFANVAVAQDVTGAGASFPAPLYAKWASEYNKATGVKINYQSVGSGAGIKQIEAKTVAFGASDMPLTDEDLAKKGLMQFPTVIGGVVPVVNDGDNTRISLDNNPGIDFVPMSPALMVQLPVHRPKQ